MLKANERRSLIDAFSAMPKRKKLESLQPDVQYEDSTVKMRLGRLQPSVDIRAAIEDMSGRVHDTVARGLLLANHITIREIASGRSPPPFDNQSWWLHCMKIWGQNYTNTDPFEFDSTIQEAFLELRERTGLDLVDTSLISHTLNQIVVTLLAGTQTHICTNFHNFLRKAFLREICIFEKDVRQVGREERSAALEASMRECLGKPTIWKSCVKLDLTEHLKSFLVGMQQRHHRVLPLADAQFLTKHDTSELLLWMAELSNHSDLCSQRDDVVFNKGLTKAHRLIPLGGRKVRNIPITKYIFTKELLPLAKRLRKGTDSIESNPKFETYFPGVSKIRPSRSSVFAEYLATDGFSVSVLFKKPIAVSLADVQKRYKKYRGFVSVESTDMQSKNLPRIPESGQRLIGIDPGRKDVVFGSVHKSDETVRMSTAHLAHVSGRTWAKRQTKHVFESVQWNGRPLRELLENLPSSKTASLQTWETFLDAYAPIMQIDLDTWKRRCFRKTALWCYGKRDKCIDQLCKSITGGKRGTLVAFGGASCCSTACGYAPAPQKRLRNRLERIHGAKVTLIRETYTSQICSECHSRLKPFRIGEVDSWHLKCCEKCKSKSGPLVWNRDRNASLNTLQVYLSLAKEGKRPQAFDYKPT